MRLRLVVRRCVNEDCELYHERRRPEQEGAFALPHGEFGLDVIALVGALRYREHRSVPEIHRELLGRGRRVLAERTVTNLIERYEELVALRLTDQRRLRERLKQQGRALLALDGMQPDVGHEVLVGGARLPARGGAAGPQPAQRHRGRPGRAAARSRGCAGGADPGRRL